MSQRLTTTSLRDQEVKLREKFIITPRLTNWNERGPPSVGVTETEETVDVRYILLAGSEETFDTRLFCVLPRSKRFPASSIDGCPAALTCPGSFRVVVYGTSGLLEGVGYWLTNFKGIRSE